MKYKRIKVCVFFIITVIVYLFTNTITATKTKAYAIQLAYKATYVSDGGDWNYGVNGIGGTKVENATYKYFDGAWGYYWATARYVDLGKAYYMDGSLNFYFDIGLNNVWYEFDYSADGSNWKRYGTGRSNRTDFISEWKSFNTTASWWSGDTVRYFKLVTLSAVDGSRPSAIDDLCVTLKQDESNPPNINIGQRFSWWSNQDQVLTADVSDTQSGIQSFNLPTAWGGWNVWGDTYNKSANKTLTGEGWYGSPTVSATDNCGNTSSRTYTAFGIDKTPPTVNTWSANGSPYVRGFDYWVKPITDIVNVYVRQSDNLSGVSSTYIRNLSYDNSIDNRLVHDWNSHSNSEFMTSPYIRITNATEGYNTTNTKDTTFTIQAQTLDKDYTVQTASYDYVSNLQNYQNLFNLRVDGTAPTISDAYYENVTINGFDVVIKNISDNGRSGVNKVTTCTWIDGWNIDGQWQDWATSGGDLRIHINRSSFSNRFGTYKMDIRTVDNVGNTSNVLRHLEVNVIDPAPINNTIKIVKYDYKESNSVYWVKQGNEFAIYNDGYFPGSYGIFPTRNYVLFDKDGTNNLGNSARQYADVNGSYTWGSEYSTYFSITRNDSKAQLSSPDGNNYLYTTHYLKALVHASYFKLRHCTTYLYNGTEYYKGYTDSGMWLKVDGEAPLVAASNEGGKFLAKTPDITLNYSDVHSGVASSQFTWSNSTDTPTTWSNYVYPVSQNAVGTWYLHYKTTDNVGNVRTGYFGPYIILPINTKPTVTFEVNPNPQFINYPLSYNVFANPMDSWDEITQYEWSYSKDNKVTWSNPVATPPNSFDTPGIYNIRLRVKDKGNELSPALWSDYCIVDVVINDVSVIGQVTHTATWEQNRINYNKSQTGTTTSPRTPDVFFPGENFVLTANTTPGANAQSVNVKIVGTTFNVNLTQTASNTWTGDLWDETMIDWDNQTVRFTFTATYQYGVVKTYDVYIKIDNAGSGYWLQHRSF